MAFAASLSTKRSVVNIARLPQRLYRHFAGDTRKVFQEFLKRRPRFQIVEQRLKRNPRPVEDRSATHYFGVADNCGTLDHSIK